MPDHNRVTLIGKLTRDIEIRHTPSNMAVGNFGLAIKVWLGTQPPRGGQQLRRWVEQVAKAHWRRWEKMGMPRMEIP